MFFDALRDLEPFVQLNNVKSVLRGVLLLVNLQVSACNFTKSNTPPWAFFTVFKLFNWYRIAQSIKYYLRWLGQGQNVHPQQNLMSSMPLSYYQEWRYYEIGQLTSVRVEGYIIIQFY